MTREGAQAPAPPPMATPPLPLKGRYSTPTGDRRGLLVHRARQSSSLRQKVVQLANQRDKQQSRDVVRLISAPSSANHPHKQDQHQQDQHQHQHQQHKNCSDCSRDSKANVRDLNTGADVSHGKTVVGCSLTERPRGPNIRAHHGPDQSRVSVSSSPEHTATHSLPPDTPPLNGPPGSSLLTQPSASRLGSFLPHPPTPTSQLEARRRSPRHVATPGVPAQGSSSGAPSHPNPSDIALPQHCSQAGPGQTHDASHDASRHQTSDISKPVTSSMTTISRTRTKVTAPRAAVKSVRSPRGAVPKERPSVDGQDTCNSPGSPRAQSSQGRSAAHSQGVPAKTSSPLDTNIRRPCNIPVKSKDLNNHPHSDGTDSRENTDDNATCPIGHSHCSPKPSVRSGESSKPSVRSGESSKLPSAEYLAKHRPRGEDLKDETHPPHGHAPSAHDLSAHGGRSVTLRRAARALRASQGPRPPWGQQQRGQGGGAVSGPGQHKTVRFLPDHTAQRVHTAGAHPQKAEGSRVVEERVGEVKGNALSHSPQLSVRPGQDRNPRNPSRFASSLEMFKRRLKMNQQRIVTEQSAEEDVYLITLETVTPLTERSQQRVSGFKPRPWQPQNPSSLPPRHHHHPPHCPQTGPLHSHVSQGHVGQEEEEEEEGEDGRGGEPEGLKEQTTSGKLPESSENWTYVPPADTVHVPLPQVKTYVLENKVTSLLSTRGQSHIPLALTRHNVHLHDIFLQRHSHHSRRNRAELERKAGIMSGGKREEGALQWVGRGASADAEYRMRRWLTDTELQCDQQPLVDFKIAIPAA